MSIFRMEEVASIIRDAGGRIVGRTRLQKIAYLLSASGLDNNFSFSYKHYGPFSEELASSTKFGALVGIFDERQDQASWGGTYSTYFLNSDTGAQEANARQKLAKLCAQTDSVVLELAATAVFLAYEGYQNPWLETANRKPEKATPERLERAKSLLSDLSEIELPRPLPGEVLH